MGGNFLLFYCSLINYYYYFFPGRSLEALNLYLTSASSPLLFLEFNLLCARQTPSVVGMASSIQIEHYSS